MRKVFKNTEASVTIEFVIGLPLILVALVFVFEFSNIFWAHHITANNVQSAARFLARAPLAEPYLTQAENIAKTGDPTTETGRYDWMKKDCDDGGICITIDQNFATFTAADFRAAGRIIKVQADVPLSLPLFGLINALSGGTTPDSINLRLVEETRYFGE